MKRLHKFLPATAVVLSLGMMGCSHNDNDAIVRSEPTRQSTPATMPPQDTRSYNRAYQSENDGTLAAAQHSSQSPTVIVVRQDAPSPAHTEPSFSENNTRTAQASESIRSTGASTAGESRNAVTLVTAEEPPLTRNETPSHEPRTGEFWVAGNWRSSSNGFVWESGRIEQDRPGLLFVPATWNPSQGGWEYTPEYWR